MFPIDPEKGLQPSITIDHRERASELVTLLAEKFTIQIATLPFGDYQLGNHLTIERKTARDLLVSIIDLRLFRQVANLKHHCTAGLLLVEGDPFQTDLHFDHRAIKGALLSIQARWQLPIILSGSAEDSCDIITTIARQDATFSDVIPLRGGYRPKRLKSKQLYVLQGLPGIGQELAKRLLNHFHSVSAVMTAPEAELMTVEGIGPAKAHHIRLVLDSQLTR
jgi:DNA excision repair protein ERCC-4